MPDSELRALADVQRAIASLHESDLGRWMERILRADADAIAVQRVSYWSLQREGTAIRCESLVVRGKTEVERGVELEATSYPSYFVALRTGQVIDAVDANEDPRTREFSDSYLRPLGIGAMLDIPVFVRGRLAGVVCHEHVGPERTWSAAEQQLALAMGQSLAQAMEVQARRLAEEAVRASERRFRAIVEAAPVAMLVTRTSDGRCLYANEAMATLTGVPVDRVTERSAQDLYFDPTQRAAVAALLESEGRVREVELLLRRADGSAYWGSVSAQPIQLEGESALIAGIVDLSERKAAETALREAHDATAAANTELRLALAALESRDARLLEDLEAARAFQQSSLPELPRVRGLDIDAGFRPLDRVGGDVYDVDRLDERSIRLFIADATGHGVSAALATMFILSEYDVARREHASPAGVLGALNRRLTGRLARLGLRFTAICADLYADTGLLRWSSAAHPGPIAVLGDRVRELPTGGTFVGVTADATFATWEDRLEVGESVCLLSDGVTDAFDVTGEGFGDERVHRALAGALAAGRPPAREVLDAIERFVGQGRMPDDDATVLVVRRTAA